MPGISFVTGAAGHIGNALVRQLLERGEQVHVLLLPGESCAPLAGLDIQAVEGDVLDSDLLHRALAGAQHVYHLAGLISIMPGWNPRVRQVNVQGTRHIIRAARQAGVARLVYTSSIHALSRAPHGVVIDEALVFDPLYTLSAYDQSKAEASLLAQDAACSGLDTVIACPTGVIGPYDFRGSEMGRIILNAMHSRLQFVINGAYDFVDVRDVAAGLVLACEKGRSGESYLLSGERLSLSGLLDLMQEATGMRYMRMPVPMSLAKIAAHLGPPYYRLTRTKPRLTPYAIVTLASNSVISNAKARRELGYVPRSLRETIYDTVQWFSEHGAR
jgi:dihydroflavonol-4-reductase